MNRRELLSLIPSIAIGAAAQPLAKSASQSASTPTLQIMKSLSKQNLLDAFDEFKRQHVKANCLDINPTDMPLLREMMGFRGAPFTPKISMFGATVREDPMQYPGTFFMNPIVDTNADLRFASRYTPCRSEEQAEGMTRLADAFVGFRTLFHGRAVAGLLMNAVDSPRLAINFDVDHYVSDLVWPKEVIGTLWGADVIVHNSNRPGFSLLLAGNGRGLVEFEW